MFFYIVKYVNIKQEISTIYEFLIESRLIKIGVDQK